MLHQQNQQFTNDIKFPLYTPPTSNIEYTNSNSHHSSDADDDLTNDVAYSQQSFSNNNTQFTTKIKENQYKEGKKKR